MTARAQVLVVGHDGSRTGAPLALLETVRWLAQDPTLDVRVSLLSGGPIVDDFATAVPTTVAPRSTLIASRAVEVASRSPRVAPAVVDPVRRALGRAAARGPGRPKPEVILANTLAAWPTAVAVSRGVPVVCWVHELDAVADRLIPLRRRAALIAHTQRFIATGPRVETMLIERWGVPLDRVVAVSAPVGHPPTGTRPDPWVSSPPSTVLGIGAAVARKGLDAFVATAAVVHPAHPETTFRWVGADQGSPTTAEARIDVTAAGLDGVITLGLPSDDIEPHWRDAAVLLHPAREDPDPRVVVEAARRGVAVVTWDTGGAADLLRSAGLSSLVAPAGDLLGLARRVGALLDDPDLARTTAAALARAAVDHHVDTVGPIVASVLASALAASAPGPAVRAEPTNAATSVDDGDEDEGAR